MKSRVVLCALAALFPLCGLACGYPDEGNMPLRRAVTKVRMLPETEAWARAMHDAGAHVQYALLLQRERQHLGRCYWTVEVRAGESLWRRFFVTPDGKNVLPEGKPKS